ncbi:MAG: MBL fold metallo-hydrolase [Acidimicrobiales bacterium]
MTTYAKGLVEVGDGVHAYLQPDGSWGWSNAGLVVGAGESALVDTLFDLPLTRQMLDTMAPLTATRPIATVVNTHANGDHCHGNQLLAGADVEVVTSAATAAEFDEVPASRLAAMVARADDSVLGRFVSMAFGPFAFEGIEVPEPTTTFSGRLALDAGGRLVELMEVGPAHTEGDVVAWIPDERVLFAGDILFIGGTPIMWAGPIGNWIAACDLIVDLEPEVVVPGHGPLTDVDGVRQVRDYLSLVETMAGQCHASGLSPLEATVEIDRTVDGGPYRSWSDRERLIVTVLGIWRELEPGYVFPDRRSPFALMAEAWARRS